MRAFLNLILTAGLATTASAQDVFPYRYHIDDLPNRLRLVTVPTDFPDVVALHIVVSTGSRNEVEPGKSGFAHFFEHMMFRGTKNHTSAQQAEIFKRIGADRNAYTTDDFTNYHTTFGKEDLETVMMLESDRFQHLEYSEKAFRTESMAVYGEYNKNSANPVSKLFEVVRDKAYQAHTYKHTTMGFLRDIRKMPRQFEYSKKFFSRWYKPEYTTVVVVGDVTHEQTLALTKKYWGEWKTGDYTVEIPVEPKQQKPILCHIKWPAPTSPWVLIAFKGPAASPDSMDMPSLDVLSSVAFSTNSSLYKKLFVEERKIDSFFPYMPDRADPGLLMIAARVRDPKDWSYVRDQIIATCEELKTSLIPDSRLAAVKSNLKYGFAAGLDSSEAIASAMSGYIARTRTPGTINQVYRMYDRVTAKDVQRVAREFFVATGRTIATLSHESLPEAEPALDHDADASAGLDFKAVLQPSSSPLISIRVQYSVGAAFDPKGKEGLAYITAQLLTNGATKGHSYDQLVEAFYPLASGVGVNVDKEMTTFTGTIHRDNLDSYYGLFREILCEPAFEQADLDRVKANTQSFLDIGLRRGDDEELGKEVMFGEIFAGHPYRHHNSGTLESIESITLNDVRQFFKRRYTAQNLIIGLAGGYPADLPKRLNKDLAAGRAGSPSKIEIRRPRPIEANRLTIIEKETRATGIHIGIPIDVKRGHPDWVALWVARSYFGEHRSENSYLYQRLREIRGLNYGDYSYIEYFPNGGGQFHPPVNIARSQQIFQVWIRPVPPQNGPFAFKAAYFELNKLVDDGMTAETFEATRNYLSKFVSLLVKTQDRSLGYALDSTFYGTGEFASYVREGLAKLTLDHVNGAIRKHLRSDRLQFVVVAKDAAGFRDAILSGEKTPISYLTKPGEDVLAEDKIIERIKVPIPSENVKIIPVEQVFKN